MAAAASASPPLLPPAAVVDLEDASAVLKADKDVVLAAVAQDGDALEYAAAALKADKDVVLAAVAQSADALEYASPALQVDRDVVLAAMQNGFVTKFIVFETSASAALKADKDALLAAVAQDGDGSAVEIAYLKAEAAGLIAYFKAEAAGLELGGFNEKDDFIEFDGDYATKGLYYYTSGTYKGQAFFGTGGTAAEENAAVSAPKSRYSTPVDIAKWQAVKAGLELGGGGNEFAGDYGTKGLYTYTLGKYKGMAFFGRGGTAAEESAAVSAPKGRVALGEESAAVSAKLSTEESADEDRGALLSEFTEEQVAEFQEAFSIVDKGAPPELPPVCRRRASLHRAASCCQREKHANRQPFPSTRSPRPRPPPPLPVSSRRRLWLDQHRGARQHDELPRRAVWRR